METKYIFAALGNPGPKVGLIIRVDYRGKQLEM
jgi:hypothetical protein